MWFTDRINGALTVSGEEGDGGTLLAGTSGTSNAVNVVLGVVWVVIVDDVSNVADILRKRLAAAASVLAVKQIL